jgi:16S rRNA (uracil1498-N3)-methyltransferase
LNLQYQPDFTDQSTGLSGEESYHVCTVLRKKAGDEIFVTNGQGKIFHCQLSDVHPGHCTLQVNGSESQDKPVPAVHLLVSILKTSERMEWLTEKAVELGVASLTFYVSDRTERKNINPGKLSKVAISAIKQSGRCWLPDITGPVTFLEALYINHPQKFVASLEQDHRTSLFQNFRVNEASAVLIGPEGDFTPREMKMSLDKGFVPVTLGKYTLRSETAALAALMTVTLASRH